MTLFAMEWAISLCKNLCYLQRKCSDKLLTLLLLSGKYEELNALSTHFIHHNRDSLLAIDSLWNFKNPCISQSILNIQPGMNFQMRDNFTIDGKEFGCKEAIISTERENSPRQPDFTALAFIYLAKSFLAMDKENLAIIDARFLRNKDCMESNV